MRREIPGNLLAAPSFTKISISHPSISRHYSGKVREVYFAGDNLIMVATDRISAFDMILPFGLPYKGYILTEISAFFLERASEIVPVWFKERPHPNVMVGIACRPIPVEIIVRGYIAGSMWRKYAAGERNFGGITLPDGLAQNDKLPQPIITPTTKSTTGHDEDITPERIIEEGILSREEYRRIEEYALALFEQGSIYAASRGLILVDTKYEFGYAPDGTITLIDEIHTPDSSRYFRIDEYEKSRNGGPPPQHLSKEVMREYMMAHNLHTRTSLSPEDFTQEAIQQAVNSYISLYELLLGKNFQPPYTTDPVPEIERRVVEVLEKIKV